MGSDQSGTANWPWTFWFEWYKAMQPLSFGFPWPLGVCASSSFLVGVPHTHITICSIHFFVNAALAIQTASLPAEHLSGASPKKKD